MKKMIVVLACALTSTAHAASKRDGLDWRFEMVGYSGEVLAPMVPNDAIRKSRLDTRLQLVKMEKEASRLFNRSPAAEPCKAYARLLTSLLDATFNAAYGPSPWGLSEVSSTAHAAGEMWRECTNAIENLK